MRLLGLILAVPAALPFFASAAIPRAPTTGDITVYVSVPRTVHRVDDLVVNTTIANTGAQDVSLLKHGLLIQHLNNFAIKDGSGHSAKFTGIEVKYSPELAAKSDEDLLVLSPGQNLTVYHNLALAYDFMSLTSGHSDLTKLGKTFYVVDPLSREVAKTTATVVLDNSGFAFEVASEKTLSSGNSVASRAPAATYNNCTGVQQLLVRTAIPFTEDYINAGNNYLQTEGSNGSLYMKWFGQDTGGNEFIVATGFNEMSTNKPESFTYNCGSSAPLCRSGYYAYVYQNMYGVVNLCSLFFDSPLVGFDSSASTLVHEFSHFFQNGGTNDSAYGVQQSLQLAEQSPDDAVINACNWEYFSVDAFENPLAD